MYVEVKVGKKGELVVPAIMRRKLGILPGAMINLNLSENKIELFPKDPNVMQKIREYSKKHATDTSKWVLGDRLYEEVLG
ncbi:MAG: AbrB/MazE/SpoVT family DNA-binding domain-containing protein [Candidatus Micrarchaeota archaeon]